MIRVPMITLLAGLTTGCATIDYVGESYEPTTHIDMYFSEAAVPREYKVVGQVMASGDQFTTASRLNDRMLARAREKGADAVIVLEISRTPMSDAKQVVETTTVSTDEHTRTIGKKADVQSTAAEHNEIRGLFIKYR